MPSLLSPLGATTDRPGPVLRFPVFYRDHAVRLVEQIISLSPLQPTKKLRRGAGKIKWKNSTSIPPVALGRLRLIANKQRMG
jgi:hypothetical protein